MPDQPTSPTTKQCSHCTKTIPFAAKRCPECHADLRNWFLRHKIMTVIGGFILLVIVLGAAGGKDDNSSVSKVGGESVSSATFHIGDTIRTDKFEFSITSVTERSRVGSQYVNSSPSEGGTYVAVQWKYKNITDKPINSFSQPSIKLYDAKDTEYSLDIDATSHFDLEVDPNRKVFSDLNPGISVTATAVFEVSKKSYAEPGWYFIVNADKKVRVEDR